MTSLSVPASGLSGHRAMALIEARRVARHPVFLVGVTLAFGVLAVMLAVDDAPAMGDQLALPVIPAFFIGLTSLITLARLTCSTQDAAEAVATAPGTEARRTTALALACLVPFTAGLAFTAAHLIAAAARGTDPREWWFQTLPDWQVWSILLALGPVACLGGGLLGVLTGRWLRFPGAAAVVVVAVVAVTMMGQFPVADVDGQSPSELRLWVPWAMFHSGSLPDGTATLFAGNPAFYLGYLLCLCSAAVLAAIWHDRTARTGAVKGAIAAVVVLGLGFLALAVLTGPEDQISPPIAFQIEG